MALTHALSTNNYGPAKLIVSTSVANGTHTTLAGAIADASVGDTIFLRDSVTENVTLTPGVNIAAWTGGTLNTPSITGTVTMTAAGTSNISGIELITNSAAIIAVTGSAASILNLYNCYLNCSNNTGITFSSSSASAQIFCFYCSATLGTTGIGLFTHTSAGFMKFKWCNILNPGSSTTASTCSAGGVDFEDCNMQIALTTSSTSAFGMWHTVIDTAGINTTPLTIGGSGANVINHNTINSGTASAISAGNTVGASNNVINSSNTNIITGSGTINYGLLTYTGASSGINTTTKNIDVASAFQKVVVQVFTSGTPTYTPTAGMKFCTIECVGGGGAGGGAAATSSVQGAAGGGGGGGGYARKTVTAATIGSSQTVTVGAGGLIGSAGNNPGNTGSTSSVGSIVSATGGSGGSGSGVSGATNIAFAAGGGGGVGSSGDFNANGNGGTGGYASGVTPTCALPGTGGGSYFGGGAVAVGAGTNSTNAGNAGTNYGGGGSGGYNLLSEASGQTGSAGAPGVVIITEYV